MSSYDGSYRSKPNMCQLCRLKNQSISFSEAVWFIERRFQLQACYACHERLKKILETSLKEEGVGQADFTSIRPPK